MMLIAEVGNMAVGQVIDRSTLVLALLHAAEPSQSAVPRRIGAMGSVGRMHTIACRGVGRADRLRQSVNHMSSMAAHPRNTPPLHGDVDECTDSGTGSGR